MDKTVRALDLFCGAGGSSWGAKAAGVKLIAGFDCWKLARETYQDNFPGAHVFSGRLERLNLKSVKKVVGRVDLILASPECTNHSVAKGKKRRCETSRRTAFQVVRFAKALAPRWIVIENVMNMRRWSNYKKFKSTLEELGYHVTEQVLNAAHFGVPQTRQRLFLLCDRKVQPDPTPKPHTVKTLKARMFVNLNGVYRWSLLGTKQRAKATLERAERAMNVIGGKKPFLLVYYGSDCNGKGGWQRLSAPLRTITTLDRFAVVKVQNGEHVMRMLQVPELKKAMGMRGMKFNHGVRRDRIKMIGNAVCPPVMKEVLSHLMNTN